MKLNETADEMVNETMNETVNGSECGVLCVGTIVTIVSPQQHLSLLF
jgi:hypothetical protein